MSKDKFKDLRREAEEQIAARESQIETLEQPDLKKLVHELAVHQVELEIQNEELRQSRTQAEEVRDRYVDLYDFAPVGYFTIDEHGRVVEANLTGCQMLKVERQKPISFEYDGIYFQDGFRVDLLVEDIVVVELKSVEEMKPVFSKQVLTYLKLMDLPVGLLLNFGAATMKEGLHRIVNNYQDPPTPRPLQNRYSRGI